MVCDLKLACVLLFALGLYGSFVGERAHAGDIGAGKTTAEGCSGCHGADGISREPLTPSLAGQPDYFTQWQLIYFRSGARKSEVMAPIAEALDNEQIRNLGTYYASLPAPKPEATPDALAKVGEKLAAQHGCKSCHAADYSGNVIAARLAGQREDVLLKALRDFKSGARVGSGVATMADVVYALNDDDMQALAHYMATHP